MQWYFLKESYESKGYFVLEGENYYHIIQVMRMEPEDKVFLTLNDQIAIATKITGITEGAVYLKEIRKEENQRELPNSTTIASGYFKREELDRIVQKSAELGAQTFLGSSVPASVVKQDAKRCTKRQQRLEKIAQKAAEQSHRQIVPSAELLETRQGLFEQLDDYGVVLVTYEESVKQGEKSNVVKIPGETKPDSRILAVFGPESGLSCDEVDYLVEHKGILCGLGPRILRTGTTSLYSLSATSYQWELVNPSFS